MLHFVAGLPALFLLHLAVQFTVQQGDKLSAQLAEKTELTDFQKTDKGGIVRFISAFSDIVQSNNPRFSSSLLCNVAACLRKPIAPRLVLPDAFNYQGNRPKNKLKTDQTIFNSFQS